MEKSNKRISAKRLKHSSFPFTYESRSKKIIGNDKNKHLLILCYLDSLRWLISPLLILLVSWLGHLLSG